MVVLTLGGFLLQKLKNAVTNLFILIPSMKKSLLLGITWITLVALTATTLYAQTVAGTSLVDKMKTAVGDFTLSTVLNPGQTGLKSAPVSGKKTGDILTAGEWNRVLELVSEGGSSGGTGVSSNIRAWVTYRNIGGTVNIIGNPYGVQSAWSGAGVTNFLNYDTIITLKEPLLDSNYAVVVSPAFNSGSGYYNWSVLDWVCVWSKISSTSLGVHCGYPGYGAYGNSIVSVAVIWEGTGGGGSSGSGPALYKCTNAQSLDTTNAPCYGASRNGGAGTNQYRVVSCSNTDASGTYTAGGLLNFGDFIANKWSFHINNSNIACTDGSVLVMDIQGGGGGGSSVNSDDYSRAKAIRASGLTLNIPSGITDWPDTIVCDGFGGWAGWRQILTLDLTASHVVWYTQTEGVGVYFNPSTGVLSQADRVGSCGASNIATICAAGRCIK
jgi:hypothetical protein